MSTDTSTHSLRAGIIWRRHPLLLPALLFAFVAVCQLMVAQRHVPGPWFLFGTDTVAHDAIVHLWVRAQIAADPMRIPLWAADIQGGIPTIGAFLWTPLAPNVWLHYLLPYPAAQVGGWMMALWIAGISAWLLARAVGMRPSGALATGAVWMLCGHVVTLIHAGHFQKVMALGWLPLAVAGFVYTARGRLRRGVLLGALGTGMMFLSGHPQIAWLGAATGGLLLLALAPWRRPALVTVRASAFAAAVALGGALGGAQLLPGIEMAGQSNRAGGVSFEEATETSYPPGELMEYLVPNWKGSSVRGDVYTGEWGERIVSDHVGIPAMLLAVAGIFLAPRRAWPWLVMGGFWLLVGLGHHTPLYRGLYVAAPGFASFRSPGTMMAGTSLAIAVLVGLSIQRMALVRGSRASLSRAVAVAAIAMVVLSLIRANRHYLIAEPWDRYRAAMVESSDLDTWAAVSGMGGRLYDPVSPLSLRPILHGRDALNGYHPVVYTVKVREDERLGLHTPEWYRFWGITHLVIPLGMDIPAEGPVLVQRFPSVGRAVLRLTQEALPRPRVRPSGWEWLDASGNVLHRIDKPIIAAPPATAAAGRYRPLSWRLGVYTTAMAVAALMFLIGLRRRRPTPDFSR